MASRSAIAAVFGAGLVQGLALVTFPAAGAVFTDAGGYGLSATAYGGMFVPQAVAAVAASWLGAGLTRRVGARRIFLLGLAANAAAMALLLASAFVMRQPTLAYGLLLLATGCLGIGFGLTVPTLNTYAAAFFPRQADRAVLAMNALLGSGTALAPVFVALFVGLGLWWGLPVLVGALLASLLVLGRRLALSDATAARREDGGHTRWPPRFWWLAAFALLYGVCETVNGNWAPLYMTRRLGASAAQASLALSAFWLLVTAGRILFALIGKWVPARTVMRALPLLLAAAFVGTAASPPALPLLGILAFALGGLGCSALLPLVISFGQAELTTVSGSVAGGLIAFYEIGYGLAAFGLGPLQATAGLSLASLFGAGGAVAIALFGLALVVARRPSPPAVQRPRAPS